MIEYIAKDFSYTVCAACFQCEAVHTGVKRKLKTCVSRQIHQKRLIISKKNDNGNLFIKKGIAIKSAILP